MLADRLIAVSCFAFLFITTATAVDAQGFVDRSSKEERAVLMHHSDKPWDADDVSCGK